MRPLAKWTILKDNLPYGDTERATYLKLIPPPRGNHKHSHEQLYLEDVHRLITQTKWQTLNEGDPRGITWMELLIRFDL